MVCQITGNNYGDKYGLITHGVVSLKEFDTNHPCDTNYWSRKISMEFGREKSDILAARRFK